MEEMDYLVLSRQDFKMYGFMDSAASKKGKAVCINTYEDETLNEYEFSKEVFEELLGEDFGKKDFYYEPNTWCFIVDAIENKLKEVLKTIKKVPKEHQQDALAYIRAYKESFFDPNIAWNDKYEDVRHEDVEIFLGEYYHHNIKKYRRDLKLYYFQMFYDNLKNNYEEGHPLYISVATVEDQKKYP